MDLLQLILIVSMVSPWGMEKLLSARNQKDGVQAVRNTAGLVFYGYELDRPGLVAMNARLPVPVTVVNLFGIDFFATPIEASLGNGGIRNVSVFTELRRLNVSYPIKDVDLAHVERLTELQWLDLGGCPITDAGLEHLKGLSEIRYLGIWSTNVSDNGLKHLKALTKLRSLNLSDTEVSDVGMEDLQDFKQLQWLSVEQTRVTREGLGRRRQALPNCRIER